MSAPILHELHEIHKSYGSIAKMIAKSEELDEGNPKVLLDAAIYYALYQYIVESKGPCTGIVKKEAKEWEKKLNEKLLQFDENIY